MSFTAFPALNRAPSDQMAEAPSTQSPAQPGTIEESPAPSQGTVAPEPGTTDPSSSQNAKPANPASTPSPSASAKSQKQQVEDVLDSPAASGIVNSDSLSKVFVLDQAYTAYGDNGLTARFTFNPSSDLVFTDVLVEVQVEDYFFEFEPVNKQLFTDKNPENLDVYILIGDATYLYDEFGQKWSKSEIGRAIFRIEVVMEANGTTVKSIKLGLFSR
jgi:hypothetical protein